MVIVERICYFTDDEDLPGVKVHIKELDDVLLRDVGNKILESGK